ncbi:putative WD domain, G-beta repeat [Leishmania naiffi]|uniref:WD domain, G-beta repeat n=1 Tax=Leishmania naiffi TaxID=5678 RepID=A0AAW3B3X3_9TRYP
MSSRSPHRGRGSARSGTFLSVGMSSSSPLSPHASSSSLSRHAHHTRLIASLAGSTAGPTAPMIGTAELCTTGASPSPIDVLRPSTSVEGMSSLTALTASSRQSTSWIPTRLTSSYCVLSAAGLQEDFYTSCLSWGTNQMALALQEDLVLFHPSHPRQASSTARISNPPAPGEVGNSTGTTSSGAFSGPRRATAVAMTRCRETSCFLGMSNGAVEMYEGRGDGTLHCTVAFAMPPPPTDYLSSLVLGRGDCGRVTSATSSGSRAARALDLLSSSVSSISCVGTSSRHPWLGSATTAARGLITLDARQVQPAIRFGTDAELSQDERAPRTSPLSASASPAVSGEPSKLQRAATFLRQHDRLCSVSWNATGSLVATGSGSGIVKVWSLSAPQRPLHTFIVDQDCSVKALCFHPGSPYVLLVGASAGAAGLRTYDLSGAEPILTSAGATAAPVTQALYDPEGHYAVTGAGVPLLPAPLSLSPPAYPALAAHAELGAASGGDGSGFREYGTGWHRSPSTRLSVANSSSVIGASGGSTLWHGSWNETEALAASPSATLDLTAGFAGTAASASSSSSAVAHSAPPNALVVWRCGIRRRENYLREALLQRSNSRGDSKGGRDDFIRHSDDADDDCGTADEDVSDVESDDIAQVDRRVRDDLWDSTAITGRGHSNTIGYPRSEWMPMYALPGHRARPLLICAPFPQSPFAGCYASIAGGEDGTIRFWRFFETTSNATHLQHRRQAQQQSATTQEDMDLLATPVLR